MKIYISPSNQYDNVYAYGDTNEMEQCFRISTAAKVALQRCGFEVKQAYKGQNIGTSIAQANNWIADLYLAIHTNACACKPSDTEKGQGCEVYVIRKTEERLKYAQPIYREIAALTKSADRGIKTADFAEIIQTDAICIYIECEFHCDEERAKWIIKNTTNLGEAICKGLCAATNRKYIVDSGQSLNTNMTVKQYQKLLKAKGYYTGKVDGIDGPLTLKAVRLFQQDRNLEVDGICGPLTQAELARTEDLDWSHYKYFGKYEFKCLCGGRYCDGYPGVVSEQLLYILNSLRDHYGKPIYVTSGQRCPRQNAAEGGVSDSRHKSGRAADITMSGINKALKNDIISRAYALGARYAYTNDSNMAGAVHIDV